MQRAISDNGMKEKTTPRKKEMLQCPTTKQIDASYSSSGASSRCLAGVSDANVSDSRPGGTSVRHFMRKSPMARHPRRLKTEAVKAAL